jgi:hypothetical protein
MKVINNIKEIKDKISKAINEDESQITFNEYIDDLIIREIIEDYIKNKILKDAKWESNFNIKNDTVCTLIKFIK